ncbi:MAG: GtrA family protein [Spirochaetales bacterium]|nr:GtrA family protein [Spirochaetales bacterium]
MKTIKSLINSTFFNFAGVGLLGVLSNSTIFFIFVDLLKLPPNAVAVAAFLAVTVQNYTLNHFWTFRGVTAGQKLSLYGWFKFLLSSLAGFGVYLLVLNGVLYFFNPPFKVIAHLCGVGTGVVFNYFGSRLFVFRRKKPVEKTGTDGNPDVSGRQDTQ